MIEVRFRKTFCIDKRKNLNAPLETKNRERYKNMIVLIHDVYNSCLTEPFLFIRERIMNADSTEKEIDRPEHHRDPSHLCYCIPYSSIANPNTNASQKVPLPLLTNLPCSRSTLRKTTSIPTILLQQLHRHLPLILLRIPTLLSTKIRFPAFRRTRDRFSLGVPSAIGNLHFLFIRRRFFGVRRRSFCAAARTWNPSNGITVFVVFRGDGVGLFAGGLGLGLRIDVVGRVVV